MSVSATKVYTDLSLQSCCDVPNGCAPSSEVLEKHYMRVFTALLILGIPSIVAFISVSGQGGFNHHHRYVLQIYPLMFMLAASLGSSFYRARAPKLLGLVLVVLMAISSLSVAPHFLSYFNTVAGGPQNGWRLLGFSNVDWGQDLLFGNEWINDHPACRPITFDLDYNGCNGDLFGLPINRPPNLPKGASIDEVRTDETQWWIISVKKLVDLPGYDGLEYLQQIEPVDRIAYSYYVYRIGAKPLP